MKVLVTGASGFVGQAMVSRLQRDAAWSVRAASRQPAPPNVDSVTIDRIDGDTDWTRAVAGVDAIVHLANRAHVVRDTASAASADYPASTSTAPSVSPSAPRPPGYAGSSSSAL